MAMTGDAAGRERLHAVQVVGFGQLAMSSEREGDIHTIALTGELDLANAPRVEDELTRVEASNAVAIIVDLSGLTFIDSTGIRLLVSAQARSRSDAGRLTLLRGQAPVQRVFELSGVAELLPFAD